MFSPVRFKKFYLVVSKRYETRVLEEMAALNAVQLVDAREVVAGEAESPDLYDGFLRMVQRCSTLLGTVSAARKRFIDLLPPPGPGIGAEEKPRVSMRIPQSEMKRTLDGYESRLEGLVIEVDKLLGDVESLDMVRVKLSMLQASNVGPSALGPHAFAVVRAGVVSDQALRQLVESLDTLQSVHEVSRARPGESLVAIVASKKYSERLDGLLTKFGFQTIELPAGLDPDPRKALASVEERMKQRLRGLAGLEESLRSLADELAARTDYVSFLREATTVLSRTKDLSVTRGWIVESAVDSLRQRVATVTANAYYLQIENPKLGEQTPVLLAKRGWLLRGFELLTSMRGIPSYNELDPTIIFAILFPLMYGMMFGDVGDGSVILVLGLLLLRSKGRFIGISSHALRSIGTIMVVGGLSGIAFGVLYGSVFLTPAFFGPVLFEPISAFGTIVEVALVFGVLQLILSLVLNIGNHVARREKREAIFGGKGVIGLIYYMLGLVLAVRLIQGGLQLSVFVSPQNLPITSGALLSLLFVFLSPLLRHLRTEDQDLSKDLIEGFGEFIEVFISFLTNSLSYLRLAAFAIAHGIFAGFASDLGSAIGAVSSLVLVNALVIVVDGFAAGIQSVRLLYYEFSTKFFAGSGQRFKPLSLKLTEGA